VFRNYLCAALRNLARNRFYSGISIAALAIGLSAALLAGLVIRNQLSYDHFIRGYQRTYLAGNVLLPAGRAPMYDVMAPSFVAAHLKLSFSEIEAVTRLLGQDVRLRQGPVEAQEILYWADRNAFDVLPLPVFAGDLKAALQRPDSIVLTRTVARKYFGRDDPVGESILLDGAHSMTVTAVIEDLPVNGTELESGIFASAAASYSPVTQEDNDPRYKPGGHGLKLGGRTYLRLAPSASVDQLQKAMPGFTRELYPELPPGLGTSLQFMPIDQVNLFPGVSPGARSRLAVIAIVGILILAAGCVVFVNLATARSTRRAREVGIRKVSGASRRALVVQFVGESLAYVLLATAVAIALTELLIPPVNAFLDAGAVFDYWRDPSLLGSIALGVVTVGILAGAHPAFVLSSFRPASALKGSMFGSGGVLARQCLVALQFAVLIGFLISSAVVYQQRIYATRDALRVNTDQMLIIRSPCNAAFETELRSLAGVRGAACSAESLLTRAAFEDVRLKDGSLAAIDMVDVEQGAIDLYGLKPLAGSFDAVSDASGPTTAGKCIINESAVRRFGFSSAAAAIGQLLPIASDQDAVAEIGGVVPDFAIHTVEQSAKPGVYYLISPNTPDARYFRLINVKLRGRSIPETLSAIDRLWSSTGNSGPPDRFFLNDYIQNLYLGMLREAQALTVFSGVAVLLACLGLVGLSASATERRIKEIGIRKAMGAGTSNIVRLLVWQFMKPVLWANVIAWPVAGLLMNRWLHGFAYHVELTPWVFVAAAALALITALLTVGAQSYQVARVRPIGALRYE
jgi:putative ABC transport system permease protein